MLVSFIFYCFGFILKHILYLSRQSYGHGMFNGSFSVTFSLVTICPFACTSNSNSSLIVDLCKNAGIAPDIAESNIHKAENGKTV